MPLLQASWFAQSHPADLARYFQTLGVVHVDLANTGDVELLIAGDPNRVSLNICVRSSVGPVMVAPTTEFDTMLFAYAILNSQQLIQDGSPNHLELTWANHGPLVQMPWFATGNAGDCIVMMAQSLVEWPAYRPTQPIKVPKCPTMMTVSA